MSNIRSFADFPEDSNDRSYRFAGGHNSAIGLEEGHKIHLYEEGFTVNDGPFRSLSNPENVLFLSSVRNGIAPPELQCQGKDIPISFIDESHKHYDPPRSQSCIPTPSTRAHATPLDISLNTDSGNTTTIHLKLFDNRRINLTVSTETTLGELRSFISRQSGVPQSRFRILHGFPPCDISGKDMETLHDTDLLGCAMTQQLIS